MCSRLEPRLGSTRKWILFISPLLSSRLSLSFLLIHSCSVRISKISISAERGGKEKSYFKLSPQQAGVGEMEYHNLTINIKHTYSR